MDPSSANPCCSRVDCNKELHGLQSALWLTSHQLHPETPLSVCWPSRRKDFALSVSLSLLSLHDPFLPAMSRSDTSSSKRPSQTTLVKVASFLPPHALPCKPDPDGCFQALSRTCYPMFPLSRMRVPWEPGYCLLTAVSPEPLADAGGNDAEKKPKFRLLTFWLTRHGPQHMA